MTMPGCANCDHAGGQHDWATPPCSLAGQARHLCRRDHPRRLRGRCRTTDCQCPGYVPVGHHTLIRLNRTGRSRTEPHQPTNARLARLARKPRRSA